MSEEDTLNKLEKIAGMAGIKYKREGGLMAFPFDMGGGRSQIVFATANTQQTPDGMNVVTFFSPCQELSSGLFSRLSRKRATELLRLNALLPVGGFCILPLAGKDHLCLKSSQIVETMEVEELKLHLIALAQLADAWEQSKGSDAY